MKFWSYRLLRYRVLKADIDVGKDLAASMLNSISGSRMFSQTVGTGCTVSDLKRPKFEVTLYRCFCHKVLFGDLRFSFL